MTGGGGRSTCGGPVGDGSKCAVVTGGGVVVVVAAECAYSQFPTSVLVRVFGVCSLTS